MFKRLFSSSFDTTELCASRLFDNETFYKVFMRDLVHANHSIYIESPFITTILAAGFDGVIMDASIFSSMKGTRGTNHYIVYSPNQIKSIFNKNPTSDNNITRE
jgi:hypothetical protein